MRLSLAAAAMLLSCTAALAQPTPPPPPDYAPPPSPGEFPSPSQPEPSQPPSMQHAPGQPPAMAPRMNARQRFAAANVTNDGKLTREQAQQAHWNPVFRHFDEIDVDRKGYVTLQDLRQWNRAKRMARQQGQGAPPPPPPN